MDDGKEREIKFALELYKEVGINWRYWGDMRFKQFTVFVIMFGAMVAATTTDRVNGSMHARVAIGALGVFLSTGLLIAEERATYYRRAYMSCALALEQRNEFEKFGGLFVYSRTYNPWPLRTDTLFRSLFAFGAGIWAGYACFAFFARSVWLMNIGGAFVGLVVFASGTYGARRFHPRAERAGFCLFKERECPRAQRRTPLVGFWPLPSTSELRPDATNQES